MFDPREGIFPIIVDADDCHYWELRALEQIREAHLTEDSTERILNATRLLILSLEKRDGENKKNRSG